MLSSESRLLLLLTLLEHPLPLSPWGNQAATALLQDPSFPLTMAEQVSGIAGDALGGASLGTVTGILQGGLFNLLNSGRNYLDRFFPPEKREALKARVAKFATERPRMAAFLLSQVALSGIPLALFIIMSVTVAIFSLLAGIIVGVVGALLFTVFCLGVALIFLLPTLFMTTFAATFVFLWGLGAYYLMKWFDQKDVPDVNAGPTSAVTKQAGLSGVPALNGDLPGPLADTLKLHKPHEKKTPVANGQAGHGKGKGQKTHHHSRSPDGQKQPQTPTAKGTGTDLPVMGDVKEKIGEVGSVAGL